MSHLGQPLRAAATELTLLLAALSLVPQVAAQGVLTVTPGPSISTTAGSGTVGYTGDGGSAIAATLARPSGIAYDATGDLFLADANNHVVREVSATGVISTVAGTGIAGYGGDGGAATSAVLDTPTAVAVDTQGNLYVADSHNHRIREISHGTITTIAGTGAQGYSGDGGPGTSAQLALPSALAVDGAGNVFIADTNNHRVRKLSAGNITTVAGNGEELFAGDGGQAAAASLDLPIGVAVDPAGNLYIADKNNHRVRIVNASGVISTLAGNSTNSFSGSYTGDGVTASTTALAKPTGVAVDAVGNVLIADTNNQRIRQVSTNGAITTLAGTGDQGFGGDTGPAVAAILNNPRAIAASANGTFLIADTRNQRLRSVASSQIAFGSQALGTTSAPQTITVSNSGTGALTVSSLNVNGPFTALAGGSCTSLPFTLSPGSSCTESIAYKPSTAGPVSGSVTVAGAGLASQTVLLNGSATSVGTTLMLTADKSSVLYGETVTLSAGVTVGPGGSQVTGGTVSFYDGQTLLGSSPVSAGKAVLSVSSLPDGVQNVNATYAGNAGYGGSTSSTLVENVADLSFTLNLLSSPTVEPGHTVAVPVALGVSGANGITSTVTLTTSGLPAALAVNFTPATSPLANGQLGFTMDVTAAPASALLQSPTVLGGSGIALALLVVPFRRRRRGNSGGRSLPASVRLLSVVGVLIFVGSLTGCGSNTGFFGQKQQTYNVTVTATATDATGGVLIRTAVVPITVQ